MSRATTVLQPGQPVTLAPAGNISFEIEAGQRFKLSQPEGEQVADLISFNRDDPRELLSMHSSRAVNLNWKLTAPHVLYSNRSREMWKIEEDLTGENYCGGGYCSEHLNIARYGARPAPARRIARPILKPRSAAMAWTAGASTSTPASTSS
jgi:uncharacterized protein YcgI (DUF1989 family)